MAQNVFQPEPERIPTTLGNAKIELTLFMPPRTRQVRDENGNAVQELDVNGDLLFDENNNPVWETEPEYGVTKITQVGPKEKKV